ncbi:MAG: methylmalonyl Co-A mutase-associated GTPase MeaB [Pseudomonadota bacterium]|nr:methylmalonyl Co-A mutase-associated GTPase MeaB [Pseudomonadota bacterium]
MLRNNKTNIINLINGVRDGNRKFLAQAITLIESEKREDQVQSQILLTKLFTNNITSIRIGITGIPGAGKSSFIETLGTNLTKTGFKVAVLTIDPSSSITGGSILGDKTRMVELSRNPDAFIRPSPTSGTLGGVKKSTRESILLCEAAGYDVILVETVGIGQSEISISEMVDFCLLILISGAGDELQGIKKGVLELADIIAINKADGDNLEASKRTALEYKNALRIFQSSEENETPVVTMSGLKNIGVDNLWEEISKKLNVIKLDGTLKKNRMIQQKKWMWEMVEEKIIREIESKTDIMKLKAEMEELISNGKITPVSAAESILKNIYS